MTSFLLRRLGAGLVLVLVVATLTFGLLSLTGSDIARNIVGVTASQEQAKEKRAELGLDQPLVVRYGEWVRAAASGDLGRSWFTGQSVTSAIGTTLPVTLSIVIAGLLVSTAISITLGAIAAVRGGALDRFIQVATVLGTAVPSFLIGLVLAYTIAVQFGWLPATGYVRLSRSPSAWLVSITLPAASLAIRATAATTQQLRGSLIDVLRMDYIRTLRSRGLSERSILFKHALRNAAPPALTVLSLQFIGLVGGAVIIEKVFGLPGIGALANNAAVQGDVPLVMGVVVVAVVIVVAVNLVIDLAYGWLNPKVRHA